jgi:hypothetical protein
MREGFDTPDKDAQTINPVVEILGKSIPGEWGIRTRVHVIRA